MSCSASRLALLRAALVDANSSAAYIRDTANIEWLTGFRGVFDHERAHALYFDADCGNAIVRTDSRYSTAMEREAAATAISVTTEDKTFADWVSKIWDTKNLAIEDSICLAEYRALQNALNLPDDNFLVETKDLVLKLRAIKDAQEIALLRNAQAITDAAFDHIVGFIRPGLTERQIQIELDNFMLLHGADALAFDSIVASGANGASPHALVTDKVVQSGECIVLDFGARKDGYCSDMTRVVFVGKPDSSLSHAWDTLRHANEVVQDELRPGVTGAEAHKIATDILEKNGYAGRMGHGLGHGVGIEIHELPNLSPRNDKPLVSGNVVTVEPGIYIPGAFGMRLEDFGVITNDGFERFTQSTHEMVIV